MPSDSSMVTETSYCIVWGGIWGRRREGATAWIEQGDCMLPESRSPQHSSSGLYLAQLDGLAWSSCSVIIQMGVFKAAQNVRDCAGSRWQFAGKGPALRLTGQQATSKGGSGPWAGDGCVLPLLNLSVHPFCMGDGNTGSLNSFLPGRLQTHVIEETVYLVVDELRSLFGWKFSQLQLSKHLQCSLSHEVWNMTMGPSAWQFSGALVTWHACPAQL